VLDPTCHVKRDGLHLIVSISTKGVLQLRAWKLEGGKPLAQELKIA